MRPRFAKIYTWAQIAALPATECGPVSLPDGFVLARDRRTGMWVPARCLGAGWTLRGWVDSTTDPASLPSGFARLQTGTGTVSGGGGGGPLVFAAPANGDAASVTWTHGSALTTGDLVVVSDISVTDPPGTSSGNYVRHSLRHANKAAQIHYATGLVGGTAKQGYWGGTATDGYFPNVTGRVQSVVECPAVTATARSRFRILSRDPTALTSAADDSATIYTKVWGASAGFDAASCAVANTNGAPTTVTADLYHMSIYTGG